MVAVLVALIGFRKNVCAQQSDNYYTLCAQWDTYFNSNPALKLEEDGEYTAYVRWKDFWRTRVNNGDPTQNGSFDLYRRSFAAYANNLSYYQRSTQVFSDWHSLGPHQKDIPTQNIGQVCSLCIDTVSDKTMRTIYIGTNSSGIWRTTDGGQNWNNITDNTSSISGISVDGVTDIAVDPSNPATLYASASSGFISNFHNTAAGVIKTMDDGQTWSKIFPPNTISVTTIYKILIDPNHTQRIFVLADTAVYRSMDGGSTWQSILQVPRVAYHISEDESRNVRTIAMKPGNADILYIATDCNHWAEHHLSEVWEIYNPWSSPTIIGDTNLTFRLPLPRGEDTIHTTRMNVAVTKADSNMIYVACIALLSNNTDSSDSSKLCVWRYQNNSWKLELDSNNTNVLDNGINDSKFEFLVSPTDSNVIYLGGLTFEKFSKENGKWYQLYCTNISLNQYDTTYHIDTRGSKILKGSTVGDNGINDVIFAGNDGGISKTSNGIQTWSNLNGNGMVITQYYGIGGANPIPNIIVGGSQDNMFWKDSSGVWSHHEFGDWGNIVVDNQNPNYMYGWNFGSLSGLNKSKNYGDTWYPKGISNQFTNEPKMNNPPMVINPISKTFYLGSKNLYISYDHDSTFTYINPTGTADTVGYGISAIGIAASDTDTMYIAYTNPSYFWDKGIKFLRSPDYGHSWKNLTDSVGFWNSDGTMFDSVLTEYEITDIAVKPDDKNTLWVSLDGFPGKDSARVLVSHDGGGHWSNYSNGLPPFPINCLRYMTGSNDRLFVGTDVGVFYIDNTLSEWQPFNTGLPVCVVTKLEINDNIQEIRAGTFGRGIWESTLSCEYYPNNPIEISQNTTWTTDTALNTNVFIDSSFTLTLLRDTVKLPPLAKIYVKQGGRLVVDGATITNKCENMWQGIEVWGRKDMPQNLLYQGYVDLIHGALIENARIGITTSNKTNSDFWNTTGGIINAQNATFRNNYKAVEFFPNDGGQHSLFRKVTFETTGPFVDGTSTPSDFVSMLSTTGVGFYGCTFRDTDPNSKTNSIPSDIAGRGIFSINSAYRIDQYDSCPKLIYPCPDPIYTPSSFSGLYMGSEH
jgi:hypothetical protein